MLSLNKHRTAAAALAAGIVATGLGFVGVAPASAAGCLVTTGGVNRVTAANHEESLTVSITAFGCDFNHYRMVKIVAVRGPDSPCRPVYFSQQLNYKPNGMFLNWGPGGTLKFCDWSNKTVPPSNGGGSW